jgi:hypothetical protein
MKRMSDTPHVWRRRLLMVSAILAYEMEMLFLGANALRPGEAPTW